MIRQAISRLQLARDDIRRWIGLRLFDRVKGSLDFSQPLKHILIVRWDAKWGDAIVSSFFIPELKKQYPEARVTILAPASMVEYFSDHLGAGRVLTLPKRPKYRQLKQTAKEVGHCDLAVHLSPRLKMKDLYFFSKLDTDSIAGMDDEIKAINIKLGKQSAGQHYAEIYKNLLTKLAVKNPDCQYLVPRDEKSKERITSFLYGISPSLLTVNPYGSGSSRRLTPENIERLITSVNELGLNLDICILMTPDKREEVVNICSKFDNTICYRETESIYDSIEIIARSSWVVSVDTAIVHIASGLNKPTVALYNPDDENFSRWHPNNQRGASINSLDGPLPDINRLPWPDVSRQINKIINNGT